MEASRNSFMRTLSLFTLLLASSGLVAAGEAGPMPSGGLMYMGTWPHHVLVMDENKQTVVDKIAMKTAVPFGFQLSADRKKLYVTTIEKSGIETVDLATNKV